jgi:hypothetical protein
VAPSATAAIAIRHLADTAQNIFMSVGAQAMLDRRNNRWKNLPVFQVK